MEPSGVPTALPSVQPSGAPSAVPSGIPTAVPSTVPTTRPSSYPSCFPTTIPTSIPSMHPTALPTDLPTGKPSISPSWVPSSGPSGVPSVDPTGIPSSAPTGCPTVIPSGQPSNEPSFKPTNAPTTIPSCAPSSLPSSPPSGLPTSKPSVNPSALPTSFPTGLPTTHPTEVPSSRPSEIPSSEPSGSPTRNPTEEPTTRPTSQPSSWPSTAPSGKPSLAPSSQPSVSPTAIPSQLPTKFPSGVPSSEPTKLPSALPSVSPSLCPTGQPSRVPSGSPSAVPTIVPSGQPTVQPSTSPSGQPTEQPSGVPTGQPTIIPSKQPTEQPSSMPSGYPTTQPTQFFDSTANEYVYACYSGCSYPGATLNPSQWGALEFCEFHEFTKCDANSISSYSCVPDCLQDCGGAFCETFAKLSYACKQSSALNFTQIQRLEDACLSAFASSETTVTQLSFEVAVEFDGFNASQFAADNGAQTATVNILSSTMKNVKSTDVTIKNVTGDSIRLNRRNLLAFQSVIVTYQVIVVVENLGFRSSQTDFAYERLTNSLRAAVDTRSVLQILRQDGAPLYSTSLFDRVEFATGSLSFAQGVMTVLKSASPSAVPSVLPSASPTVAPTFILDSTIAITTAISFVLFCFCSCCLVLLYLGCRARKKAGNRYKKSKVAVCNDEVQHEEQVKMTTVSDDLFSRSIFDETPVPLNTNSTSDQGGATATESENQSVESLGISFALPGFDVNAPASWDDSAFISSRVVLPPVQSRGATGSTFRRTRKPRNRNVVVDGEMDVALHEEVSIEGMPRRIGPGGGYTSGDEVQAGPFTNRHGEQEKIDFNGHRKSRNMSGVVPPGGRGRDSADASFDIDLTTLPGREFVVGVESSNVRGAMLRGEKVYAATSVRSRSGRRRIGRNVEQSAPDGPGMSLDSPQKPGALDLDKEVPLIDAVLSVPHRVNSRRKRAHTVRVKPGESTVFESSDGK